MIPGKPARLRNWQCPECSLDWVPGEALATFLPTVKAFEKLRAAAGSGQTSTRSLLCPVCRDEPLHIVKAAGAEIDVCPRCVGIACDPGELSVLKSMGRGTAERVVDTVSGIDALAQILTLFC
jgi:Transcription factor zinc-finger